MAELCKVRSQYGWLIESLELGQLYLSFDALKDNIKDWS